MTENPDVFHLDDASDLPEKLVEELTLRVDDRGGVRGMVLGAFIEAKRPLNLNEVIVYCYRRHDKVLPRSTGYNALYRLTKGEGALLKKMRNGYYRLKLKGKIT